VTDIAQRQPFNGINAVTGEYGLTLSAEELVQRVFGNADNEKMRRQQAEFATVAKAAERVVSRNVRQDIDGTDLAQAGWGIIFAAVDPQWQAIAEALAPLLTLRQSQAGALFRCFTGVDAYRPAETKSDFLRRFQISAGAVDPQKGLPYYLLLIGTPELIPFAFQYQLDVQFAVGRLDFATVGEYANYARAVVAAETGQQQLARSATFFSVVNQDDRATQNSDNYLVQPLANALAATPGWTLTTQRGASANRAQLEALLGGAQKPALLFTASHGIEFPAGDPQQERRQGALLCSDWPGPKQWHGALSEEFYFAGEHLMSSADPGGLIAFHFACFGGGTPQFYDFEQPTALVPQSSDERRRIAARPFVANLPKRLLGHPKGGALAVVSHVDRAWSYSYRLGETAQTAVFEDTLTRLFRGQPLGWALEYFNTRYAELAADLSSELTQLHWQRDRQPFELAARWTENHDARNYVVLGDPAVRVAVARDHALGMAQRPALIPLHSDGRPVTISPQDWQQTPIVVRTALTTALQQVQQLSTQLDQATTVAPVTPRPVLRDGGRSSGSQSGSATTRGGAMRAWSPPTDEHATDR
jgi:hypothetical protein